MSELSSYTPTLDKIQQMTGMEPYLVGGAVRDALRGQKSKDTDVMVVGGAKHLADLQSKGWVSTGKSFPVFKHPEMPEVDLAFARGETKIGSGHSGFSYHLANSVEEDLSRRDFTMNAIAFNPRKGLIDPHGGQHDLSKGVIKHVSDAFGEDPLRVFRAARFASKFGFSVHPNTLYKMRSMGGELGTLSKDRVREEFLKGLNSPHPGKFFHALKDSNTLKPWFPEIHNLIGVPAGKAEHHPEGDTFNHTMHALQYGADKGHSELARMFALAHDLGKADTPREEWPAHHGHEGRTENADALLGRLGFNEGVRRHTAGHIRHHLLPNMPRLRPTTVVNYWKATRRFRDDHFDAYHADMNAHGSKDYKESPRVAQLKDLFSTLDSVKVEPSKNVQTIHQQFQRAAATAMSNMPTLEKNKYGN